MTSSIDKENLQLLTKAVTRFLPTLWDIVLGVFFASLLLFTFHQSLALYDSYTFQYPVQSPVPPGLVLQRLPRLTIRTFEQMFDDLNWTEVPSPDINYLVHNFVNTNAQSLIAFERRHKHADYLEIATYKYHHYRHELFYNPGNEYYENRMQYFKYHMLFSENKELFVTGELCQIKKKEIEDLLIKIELVKPNYCRDGYEKLYWRQLTSQLVKIKNRLETLIDVN
eukprot:TRINITY_DN13546_c0_g1_i1.p1 TRINITY_DN13546_c0_g1~~TRINITY_DN13546_c0_g1_i1.p1  ORF type:complete len:225 (+),score=28.59 TRINITY_DN13546_c0_g1_i1:62-736(+)